MGVCQHDHVTDLVNDYKKSSVDNSDFVFCPSKNVYYYDDDENKAECPHEFSNMTIEYSPVVSENMK